MSAVGGGPRGLSSARAVLQVLAHLREHPEGVRAGDVAALLGKSQSTAYYGIWEPKWQLDMLTSWDYPDEQFSDYPAFTDASKKEILGLNAARLYDIEVPSELQLPDEAGTPAARDDAQLVQGGPARAPSWRRWTP